MAELQLSVGELHIAVAAASYEQPAVAASENSNSSAAGTSAASAVAGMVALAAGNAKGPSHLDLQAELTELKARVADLSACMAGNAAPLQGGAVEDTFLPFMETTSNCLQQHEQQLDAIQVCPPAVITVLLLTLLADVLLLAALQHIRCGDTASR